MALNNFATEAKEITKDNAINSSTFLNASIIYVGTAGDLNVIVHGTKEPGKTTGLEIISGGSGYNSATNVATTGGHGSGLTVQVIAYGNNVVGGIIIEDTGSGYQINDIIKIAGGDGNAELKVVNVSDLPQAQQAVKFAGVQAGTTLDVLVDYVLATDTTAGELVSLK
jgi:hypothetical protein